MKRSTIAIIAFVAFIIVYLLVTKRREQAVKEKNKFTASIPNEYLDLFSAAAQQQFMSNGTIRMPSGLFVSSTTYFYHKSGFPSVCILQIFKVPVKGNKPLYELMQISRYYKAEGAGKNFTSLRSGGFDLSYKDGKSDSIEKVTWNFKGDVLRLNSKEADLLYYDIDFKSFAIKYGNGSEILADKTGLFFVAATGKIIFLKKGGALYTIFISDTEMVPPKKDTTLTLLNHDLIN